jgi:O-acetyl-ADP-ribose deacetylase (regulator of RNase III)
MREFTFRIISERDAADAILRNRGSFVPWIGAGVSVESRIPAAQAICDEMAQEMVSKIETERRITEKSPFELTPAEREDFLDRELSWRDPSVRYARSIKRRYPGRPERVDYFRRIVSGRAPCFAHYAIALLVRSKIFSADCITTNFDKLLERAFHDIGEMECQPIRTADELQFHQRYEDKAFCIKIHGDYDTHNLLNTEDETVIIEDRIARYLEDILKNKGTLVIGSAGFEKSIHTLFDNLTSKDSGNKRVLEYGLLWGVYVGDDSEDPVAEVHRLIEDGSISKEIVKVMDRNYRAPSQFAFFPVTGGAGEFMRQMILYSNDTLLLQSAEPYFDHEMRIRSIFRRHQLPPKAASEHIGRLRQAQRRTESAALPARPIWVFKDREIPSRPFVLSFCYGSLADTRLLVEGKQECKRAAILSPDDTFISMGGGTALAIARAAGYRNMVHNVSKLAPIPLGDVAVTTAGNLPVEYVLHGASVEILEDRIHWSEDSIRSTVHRALSSCGALGVDALFVPLLAAGTGRAPAKVSISQIFQAISEFDPRHGFKKTGPQRMNINIVAFQESELPREICETEFKSRFGR